MEPKVIDALDRLKIIINAHYKKEEEKRKNLESSKALEFTFRLFFEKEFRGLSREEANSFKKIILTCFHPNSPARNKNFSESEIEQITFLKGRCLETESIFKIIGTSFDKVFPQIIEVDAPEDEGVIRKTYPSNDPLQIALLEQYYNLLEHIVDCHKAHKDTYTLFYMLHTNQNNKAFLDIIYKKQPPLREHFRFMDLRLVEQMQISVNNLIKLHLCLRKVMQNLKHSQKDRIITESDLNGEAVKLKALYSHHAHLEGLHKVLETSRDSQLRNNGWYYRVGVAIVISAGIALCGLSFAVLGPNFAIPYLVTMSAILLIKYMEYRSQKILQKIELNPYFQYVNQPHDYYDEVRNPKSPPCKPDDVPKGCNVNFDEPNGIFNQFTRKRPDQSNRNQEKNPNNRPRP